VFNDFYKDDVWVVDGGKCEFGVESTVLKIVNDGIKIFREGSLSVHKIKELLWK
jgi:tRNA A37 threonylcarbamoyladenosine synthetase subunit TsaC/SUA5/YrdC